MVGHLAGAGFKIATSGASERQGIVQRLDVGTSGVMVICKSEHAYSVLKNAFRRRDVDKVYHALVQGHPDPLEGTVDAPIGRHPKADYKFAVMADGRPSVTHYSTLEAHRFASLLEVHLETGRTHQIRVHMAALKHPCVGDLTYGADPTLAKRFGLERQWLHAVRLGFEHPDVGGVRRVLRRTTPTTWPARSRQSVVPTDDALVLRPATREDLPAIADVHIRARDAAYPAMPRSLHPPDEAHAWVAGWDLAKYDVWVAESPASRWSATPGSTGSGSTTSTSSPPPRAPASARRCSTWSRPSGRPASACGSSRATSPRAASTPPRPGRPRAHRRRRQRGARARHPDGLARRATRWRSTAA